MKVSPLALLVAASAGGAAAFTAPRAAPRLARASSAPAVAIGALSPPVGAEASATALAGRRRKGGAKRKPGKGTGALQRPSTSSVAHSDIDEAGVRALFSLWNNALATGDSRIVAKRYADTSILLPTVSDTPRTDFDSIKDYFDSFLLKKPQGKILEGDIRIGDGWAQDAG